MLKKLISVPILVFYCVAAEPICTNGFTLVNNKCLKLMSTTTNYNSAEQYCRGFGATLMTVKDSVENDDIKTFLKSSASTVWMRIYCITNEHCFWDDSSKNVSNYSNFATGFPLTDEGNCVYFAVATGKWISGDCDSQQRASVCEMPTTVADDCPNNFNGNCYTFHDKQKFGDAQKICQQESGNLASIISEQENRYIMSQASQLVSGDLLIGATWSTDNNEQWLDGSTWQYSNIDPAYQHIMNCMAIANSVVHFAKGWYSVSCGMPYSFICKRPAGSTVSTTVPPTSTVPPTATVPPTVPPTAADALATVTQNCNSTLPMAPGFFTSPGFPANLAAPIFCTYQLNTIGSYRILLRIIDFVPESSDNVINVYDGDSTTLFGSFNGYTPLASLVSSGNRMMVTFSSGSTESFQGFSATYTPYSG